MVADGVEDTVTDNGGQKLLNVQSQEDGTDGGQDEVVDEEQALELEGLAVAHQLATTEDDAVVDDDEDGSRLEGRHGRLERDELELFGRVAHAGGPCLVENGPEVNAEGAIERRQRELLVEGGGSGRGHRVDGGANAVCRWDIRFVLKGGGRNQKGYNLCREEGGEESGRRATRAKQSNPGKDAREGWFATATRWSKKFLGRRRICVVVRDWSESGDQGRRSDKNRKRGVKRRKKEGLDTIPQRLEKMTEMRRWVEREGREEEGE